MSNDHWKADWEHIAFNLCSEFGSDFVADKHDFAKAVVREYLRSLRPVDHSELVERLHGPVFGTPTALQAADALDAHNIEIERLKLAIEGETAESISDQQAVDIIEYVWGTAPHQALGDLEEALRTMLRLFDDKQNMVEGPRQAQAAISNAYRALGGNPIPASPRPAAADAGVREALRDIVEFCDDPEGSEKPESLGMGLARLLPAARVALSLAAKRGADQWLT